MLLHRQLLCACNVLFSVLHVRSSLPSNSVTNSTGFNSTSDSCFSVVANNPRENVVEDKRRNFVGIKSLRNVAMSLYRTHDENNVRNESTPSSSYVSRSSVSYAPFADSRDREKNTQDKSILEYEGAGGSDVLRSLYQIEKIRKDDSTFREPFDSTNSTNFLDSNDFEVNVRAKNVSESAVKRRKRRSTLDERAVDITNATINVSKTLDEWEDRKNVNTSRSGLLVPNSPKRNNSTNITSSVPLGYLDSINCTEGKCNETVSIFGNATNKIIKGPDQPEDRKSINNTRSDSNVPISHVHHSSSPSNQREDLKNVNASKSDLNASTSPKHHDIANITSSFPSTNLSSTINRSNCTREKCNETLATSRNPTRNVSKVDNTSTSELPSIFERHESWHGTTNESTLTGGIMPRCKTDRPCIRLCCPLFNRLIKNNCIEVNETFRFPPVHRPDTLEVTKKVVNEENFEFVVWNFCPSGQRYKLDPEEYDDDAYVLLENGTILQIEYNKLHFQEDYCFGVLEDNKYDVVLCFEENNSENVYDDVPPMYPIGMLISMPFLFATFLVYTVLPSLQNTHGYTLRSYIGSLLFAYIILSVAQIVSQDQISDTVCVLIAFTIHFSFLASFFWLNVMCFDIWWTFGGFRSLQGSMKQREQKKFTMYSIYAWGSASLLTVICIIMDTIPDLPENIIRPQFGVTCCWFTTDAAKAVYFYGPMGITVICNIGFFVSTALKIIRHKQDTAHHLKGTDSRRHDDNKQWFNLYLKLFIVMGINWSMEVISWLFKNEPRFIWYITDLTNTLQGVIIFLIFVWKGKIKHLLLKKLGCHNRKTLSNNSTRSAYHSSTSRTCITSAPLQEKVNPYHNGNYRNKPSVYDSDCA